MAKVKLGEVAKEYKATVKDAADLPVVGLEHLIPGQVELTQWSEDADNTFTKGFKKGQMLFGRRRAYLKKAALAPFDGICSGDITVIEAIPERIMPELLPFVIQNDSLFDYAVEKSAGSLSPRVKWEHLKNYEFELPEKEQQRALVDLLWAMTRTKKAYQELVKKTDELVKSQFIETFGNGVDNPNKWEEGLLGEVCDVRDGTHDTPKYYDEGFPLVTSKNVTDGYINFTDCNLISENDYKKISERSGVSVGDILMPMIGTVGKPVIVEDDREFAIKNVLLIKFREGTKVINKYILALLQSSYFDDMVLSNLKGGNQKFVSLKDMRGLHVLVPPIELQEKFDDFMRQSDKSKFELTQAISRIDDMIKTLMQG